MRNLEKGDNSVKIDRILPKVNQKLSSSCSPDILEICQKLIRSSTPLTQSVSQIS